MQANRSEVAVRDALARIAKDATDPLVNLVPALIEAAAAYVTVGEVTDTLESEFGTYVERASV